MTAIAASTTTVIKNQRGLPGICANIKYNEFLFADWQQTIASFYTAKDALQENFETYIIEDATRAIRQADFENCKRIIQAEGGQLIESKFLHRHL